MLRALLQYLQTEGIDAHALAERTGLRRADWAHPERAVAATIYERLMQDGIAGLRNPLLGLEFGMAVSPERWGRLGFLLRHCATLGEALVYQTRYATLVNATGRGVFVDDGAGAAIEWRAPGPTMPALVEEAFAAWLQFARWASASEAAPTRVTFAHRAQGDPAAYEDFFACPVAFDAPASRLCFDRGLLDLRLRTPDAQLTRQLDARFAERARSREGAQVEQALRDWITATLGRRAPDLHAAANALNLTDRTLQHRLQARGTSFRRCLDDTRRDLALAQLEHSQGSIGDISLRLGFSEQSAFQRAFRRWTGTTPLAWRRRRPRAR